MNDNSFIGRGWGFPPRFITPDPEVGRPSSGPIMVTQEEEISQSISLILSTTPGERVMRPEFGSKLADFVFEEMSANALAELKDFIASAITKFELRIDLNTVEIDTSGSAEGLLQIHVDYIIRDTNTRGNLVYPFLLNG